MRTAFPRDALSEGDPFEWMRVFYQSALGTTYVDPECEVAEEGPAAIVVECEATMITAIHERTGTLGGVPSRVIVTVATD